MYFLMNPRQQRLCPSSISCMLVHVCHNVCSDGTEQWKLLRPDLCDGGQKVEEIQIHHFSRSGWLRARLTPRIKNEQKRKFWECKWITATEILSGVKNTMFGRPRGRQVLTPAFVYVIIKNKGFKFYFFADTELKECFNLTTSSLGVYRRTGSADLVLGSFPSLLCRTSGVGGQGPAQVPPHVGLGSGQGFESLLLAGGSKVLPGLEQGSWGTFTDSWASRTFRLVSTREGLSIRRSCRCFLPVCVSESGPPPTLDCSAHVATLSN